MSSRAAVLSSQTKSKSGLLLGIAAALIVCSGAAFWIGTETPRELTSEAYADQRLPLINSQLNEAKPGFIFLSGDSHSELLNTTYRLCGRELVNGGVSGAKAELYRDFVNRLALDAAPAAVVYSIGTNNLLRKKKPLSAAPTRSFEDNVARTVAAFRRKAPRVIVLAVPPISTELKDKFEIAAVSAYSQVLQSACKRAGCEVIDPYDFARESDGNTARPQATRDGIHLSSYRAVHERMEQLLCPGGTL
ncbi:SGNH/GDSL hydrolase family protein [Microvirga sp. 2YAF29]|uniref:SGNH/GDSL hydrolase family protein n=1 Tax=Microvirga sp. 2YAF29 TaxID=3233031 RepID=UPI003F95BBBC